MVNEREKKILNKYENDGWKAIRGGAPDFLFLKADEGKIVDQKFVEVKSQNSSLKYEQDIWRKVIESLGADYKVEVVK